MSEEKYRAAAIGRTGQGGYGHGLHIAYQGIDQVEFVAVADPDEAGRLKAQAETNAPRAYADYREMLRTEKPDLVSVCPRWTDCHLEMVLACLEAGAHVYCEKPLTWNLAEGDRIVAEAASRRLKVAVAHQGVYLPRVQHLKGLLAQGRIGQVHSLHAHGKQDQRGGGEDMIVLGTHLFNMMRFFVGEVAWMSAQVQVEGRELAKEDIRQPTEPVGPVAGDCIHSFFSFKGGPVGFFESRRHQAGGNQRYGLDIAGSEGIISLRGGSGNELMIYPHPVFRPADPAQRWQPLDEVPDQPLAKGNRLAILDLIRAIEEDRPPLSSAADAVAALEMILGAYESQITGGRVCFPTPHRRHPLAAWQEGFYG
ncbi:MAG: Gfo/Idh/MocA family oxidoreductase [Candidatus Handelsmanbacteria bacterium]|nr:Gfo/Idh/MocA family oxidoreductase [Candidatus Handelsmanbacteria bacterium]